MTEDFEFEKDTEINQNDLDAEWIRQPGLYGHWASKYADELKVKDRIWLQKKILKAKLYGKYRADLTVADKAPTETRVDATVHADPEYEKISLELIDAEWRVNKCDAAKWSFEHKKKSLEQLSESRDRAYNMPDAYRREVSAQIDSLAREKMRIKRG